MHQSISKADLHTHTTASDGYESPEELVERAATHTDLRVLAITDHDTVEGGYRAYEYWQKNRSRLSHIEIVKGIEVSSRDGHILGLFIERDIQPGQSIEATIAAIHAQGGLAIAAHPFTPMNLIFGNQGVKTVVAKDVGFDAVEVINSAPTELFANVKAHRFNQQNLSLPETGGSDSHYWTMVGKSYTRFPGHTAEDLRQALLAGTVEAGGHIVSPLMVLPGIWKIILDHTIHRAHHKGAQRSKRRTEFSVDGGRAK